MLKVTNLFLLTILNMAVPMCAPGCMYGTGGRWEGSWGCAWSDIPLCVVDRIPETWCVHNGEPQLHALLFYVHCMLSDFHSLHDPLWRRGKLRPRQEPGPAPSGQIAHPNQLDCLIHTAPLPTLRLPGGLFSGNQQGTHFPTQEMPVAVGSGPSLLLLSALFLDSWNPLGVRDSLKGQDSGPCPASAPKSLGSWLLSCQAR